jgi:membrane-bound serine protease (ClpP class)
VMLLLDTPGGGLTETYEIIRQMEETRVPVIAYVYPAGTSAWSAGTLILMGSDVAAMAPHCIIGSAQPVQLSALGEAEPINDSKTTNAIVALIEEKARAHGRNTTAAREFVVSNLNLNADEAKNYGVIEYVAASPEELLGQINGSSARNTTMLTEGAAVQYFQPPINMQLLRLLSDPTLAGLLMLVGLYALVFGLSSPGIGSEALGVVALALGLIGQGFNVNLGAVFLLLIGLGLILMELHSHSFGILAVAGLSGKHPFYSYQLSPVVRAGRLPAFHGCGHHTALTDLGRIPGLCHLQGSASQGFPAGNGPLRRRGGSGH